MKNIFKVLISAFLVFCLASNLKADDIEIYFGASSPANVLLVLDTSGSMNTEDVTCTDSNGNDYKCSRLQALKDGVEIFLDSIEDNVRVGVMRFPAQSSGNTILGGELLYPVSPMGELAGVSEYSHRDRVKAIVKNLSAQGGTPLTQTFEQAVKYFAGDFKHLSGSKSVTLTYDQKNLATGQISYGLTWSQKFPQYFGSLVDTPIEQQCLLRNKIVLLTDGVPNSTLNATKDDINTLTSASCTTANENDESTYDTRNGRVLDTERNIFSGKDCAVELAKYSANTDLISSMPGSYVEVDTLGFALDSDDPKEYLKQVADAGNGTAYEASDAQSLANAFNASLDSVSESSSFVAPSVPLSQSNRLSSGNELFLAMFKPESKQLWHGNLKKYFLKDGKIVDKNGAIAVNDKGAFYSSASSAWSQADGDSVVFGGAAQAMSMPRSVYSNILEKNLWTNKNQIITSNNKITNELLGLPASASTAELQQHISWIYNQKVPYDSDGDGVNDTTVNRFGDPLHSKPVMVRYDVGNTVFVGSNQGYLHAINPDNTSGDELWSFMPRQLLSNVATWAKDKDLASTSGRVYGLDGEITVYHEDKDRDAVIDAGEKAYLYVGMRRGGRNYYAIDISDRTKPQLMFTITGDKATYDETQSGNLAWDQVEYYDGLAQTWSKPVIGMMRWGKQQRLVMLFGGGYDATSQDNSSTTAGNTDSLGNNIFIADAVTGQMLWNAKDNAMHKRSGDLSGLLTNSFAASLSVGDLTGSGTIEHFYAADLGGQLFRFDVMVKNNSTSIQGAKVADIQGSGVAGNRRFYNKPDVSFVRMQGTTMAMIAIGSGYRAHPLNDATSDRFYVFFDKEIVNKKFDNSVFNESSLYNISKKIKGVDGKDRFATIFDIFNAKKKGWYLELAKGEKVLSDSTTINYRIFFTTYSPSNNPNSCSVSVGSNKLYAMSVLDGRPAFNEFDHNSSGTLDELDERSTEVNYVGIAPGFTVLFPEDDTSIVSYVGAEQICSGAKCDFANELTTVKWREIDDKQRQAIINAK
ncbi:MAG: VWA domain-containing protein [Gammaproteobacteria bacterium]|nr:VWA domain-containing protein [Gammaproteobacteria bacterium]